MIGFDQPLARLQAANRALEERLLTLLRLASRTPGRDLNGPEREQVLIAWNHLRAEGRHQLADQVDSLLPRLRGYRLASTLASRLNGLLDRLCTAHTAVERDLHHWLAGRLTGAHVEPVLLELWKAHRETEEIQLARVCAEVLSPQELAEIGREMAQRRRLLA